MFVGNSVTLLLFSATCASALVTQNKNAQDMIFKRAISPDNTCGGANAFTCDPNAPRGGPCCSAAGFCGRTVPYCGEGCNPAFGTCFGVSPPATKQGDVYKVSGVGSFTTSKTYVFDQDGKLPAGLQPSTDLINSKPLKHKFKASNIDVSGGFMNLLVPGGQTQQPISSAEVATVENKIMYGSVRTYAQFSQVHGTVHGLFFYKNDHQEMDIEYVTNPNANTNRGKSIIQYTNQALHKGGKPTHSSSPAPPDATTAVHEYRIDWLPGQTLYYLDGILQKTFTKNVPTVPGEWIWNNWSDGDVNFTEGPPPTDNILKIQKIVMYYNVSSAA